MSQAALDLFKAAVQDVEQKHDIGPLVKLFGPDSTLDSPAHEQPLRGVAGAEVFWGEYLDAFQDVKSTFTNEQLAGDTAILEWSSKGTLPTGRAVTYRGVSLVTFAGDRIKRFVTYYDSAQFVSDANVPMTVETGWKNDDGGD